MALIFNIAALFVVTLTGAMHYIGVQDGYLWHLPWYDIPLHMMGGLTLGLWSAAVSTRMHFNWRKALLFTLVVFFFFGIIWEVWEYASGLTQGEPGYWFDTTKDFVDGCIGSLVGWGIYVVTQKKKQ